MSRLLDFLLARWETPAEKARREGTLVYDEDADEWIELPHEE